MYRATLCALRAEGKPCQQQGAYTNSQGVYSTDQLMCGRHALQSNLQQQYWIRLDEMLPATKACPVSKLELHIVDIAISAFTA